MPQGPPGPGHGSDNFQAAATHRPLSSWSAARICTRGFLCFRLLQEVFSGVCCALCFRIVVGVACASHAGGGGGGGGGGG